MVNPGPFSALITWTIPEVVFVREYQLNYTYRGACPEANRQVITTTIRGGASTSYTIENLIANSFYEGELVAFNDGGSSESIGFNFTTDSAGMIHGTWGKGATS